MARVTVEDCVLRVPNRFELVMLAAQRARNLGAGAPLSLDRDNDKNPVVALREIADGTVELGDLEQGLVRGLQKIVEPDEPESEDLDFLTQPDEFGGDVLEMASREEMEADDLSVEAEAEEEAGAEGEAEAGENEGPELPEIDTEEEAPTRHPDGGMSDD